MTLEPIFQPDKRKRGPQPAKVDLHLVFLIGTTIWIIVSLIVFLIRKEAGHRMTTITLLTCAFGVIIGLVLLIWESINRSHYTKLAGGAREDGSFGVTDETGLPAEPAQSAQPAQSTQSNQTTQPTQTIQPTQTK
jgi:hypothetical protein